MTTNKKRTGNYARKWNTDAIKQYIEDNNLNVELLSEYVDMYTKMDFRCICGEIFSANWHDFNDKRFPKRQCNSCGRKKPNENKITCDYIRQYLIDNNYTCKLLSTEYISCDDKLMFECECGNIFYASWSNIKKMKGLCKKCSSVGKSKILRKSDEELQKQIDDIYGSDQFEIIERNFSRLRIRHLVCNEEFEIKQSHLIDGQGCKFCNKKNRDYGALSNDVFLNRVEQYFDEYEFLTEYVNNHTPITIRCKKCGNIFKQLPYHIYDRGVYCYSCNVSRGEQRIEKYLKTNKINFIPQYRFNDCKLKKPLPFDFYLPDFNVCVEFQGIQHYQPVDVFGGLTAFEGQIKRDGIKKSYCKINNITLIEISYLDYDNIDNILDEVINRPYVKGVV